MRLWSIFAFVFALFSDYLRLEIVEIILENTSKVSTVSFIGPSKEKLLVVPKIQVLSKVSSVFPLIFYVSSPSRFPNTFSSLLVKMLFASSNFIVDTLHETQNIVYRYLSNELGLAYKHSSWIPSTLDFQQK